MQLLSSLVEGWPFPRSRSVHHSSWETPAGVRVAPSLWRGSLKFPVVAMQARTPGIILPVYVAFVWSRQITVVAAISVVEWTHGVVMPVLGFKLQLFIIPNS